MRNVLVLLAFNADGNMMHNNVLNFGDSTFTSIRSLVSDALLAIPSYMIQGDPPGKLIEWSGRDALITNESGLAQTISQSKYDERVLVFGNDSMLSALDEYDCEYWLAVWTPSKCNEKYPSEYVDGFERVKQLQFDFDTVEVFMPSVKNLSTAKLERSIDGLEAWLNSPDSTCESVAEPHDELSDSVDDYIEKFENDNFCDDYCDDDGYDSQLDMIKMAADQVKQCLSTVDEIKLHLNKLKGLGDVVHNAVVRIDQSIIHNNKVSIDTENYVNNRVEGFNVDLDGLRQQVGIIAEQLENKPSVKIANTAIWLILIVSIALNIINLLW